MDLDYIFHTFLQKVPNHFLHFSSKSPKILTSFSLHDLLIMILQCYVSWFMFLMISTWFFIIWSWFTGFWLSFLAFWQSRKALTEVNKLYDDLKNISGICCKFTKIHDWQRLDDFHNMYRKVGSSSRPWIVAAPQMIFPLLTFVWCVHILF